MTKKKKEELKPEMIQNDDFDLKKLKNIAENINKAEFTIKADKSNDSTYYKQVISELISDDNVETKTEFNNDAEILEAVGLTFLGNYADIPLLADAVKLIEKKRISKDRKGREELILSLQKRNEEEMELRKMTMLSMGMNNKTM